ncbi:bifunctional 4'-phosphopantothenoylcysteine decarboxylase/phosphopantothenoylcysteine synthetase [Halorhodospira abdelmalekii]|uniref:bifunctional phosphopantothenoylcysteine decarboxylase/phosphopantothenate synthase n=1 Tax=Halorhodospira abdelmalekii TaxID=421629 RepID=UPI00190781B7|nr:bifunctional phosphopantothenoylcysteine decarboxylase/phosphopantothenate synthase [Halorhodospira abdelmalekii]MBK1734413.1 bifunctional 4'-phosphopantothenoylcysteine decarboxylase/phosphopantothenoylcysteine synthetase [Halorhodospira abdelmalekii]
MTSASDTGATGVGEAAAELRVLLIVTGGIAAYKAAELVRLLRRHGCCVQVAMTAGAQRFITPLTFQALSGERVHTDLLDPEAEAAMGHIELARWAQWVVVAPASADFIARLAHGRADDLPSAVALATRAPLAIAPAMNVAMWEAAATQENIGVLQRRGVTIWGPAQGEQACGEIGAGRLVEPEQLVAWLLAAAATPAPAAAAAAAALPEAHAAMLPEAYAAAPMPPITPFPHAPLAGKSVLITAGPTREPLDPVRYLTNRSSGRMGFAVAAAAHAAGARVVLIAGPCALPTPPGVERHDVERAEEMHTAVLARLDEAELFIGTAAVCDYRPAEEAHQKIKKAQAEWSLALERTPDILRDVAARQSRPFVVGFAAETDEVITHARRKLVDKQLDMIAANRVGPGIGFDRTDNSLEVLWADGAVSLPQQPKPELARALLELIIERFAVSTAAANER